MKLPRADAPDRLMRELDWNLLRTFVVLAEAGTVTGAAEKLRLKQPTVSAALKRLEERLGKRLIERRPGHFRLTEAGELLYREAVDIQGSILRLSTLMRDVADEVQGHVKIAVASHVVCPIFDDALVQFHARHPKATLSIDVMTSRDALAAVTAKAATMAICLVRHRNPRLEYRRLYREFFGLYCGPPHPLFGRGDIGQKDLAGLPTVSFETDRLHDVLRPVTLMRAEAELGERIVGQSSHLEEVRRMIIAGLGVGPLPVHVVRRDVEDGLLWALPPHDRRPAIDVHIVWNPQSGLNRAEEAMLSGMIEKIETTPIEERTYA